MLPEPSASFHQYRAPQADGQTLIDPPLAKLPAVMDRNRERLATVDGRFLGRSLAEISTIARRSLVERALAYTRQYRDLPERAPNPQVPVILSGHQPQLYHAGVWYKNFVLGALSRRVGGIGIHLLIDSDLCRGASIRVPADGLGTPHVETVEYDQPAAEIPYEERAIRDHDTFSRFAGRVVATIQPIVDEPLVKTLWPLVLDRSRHESNLGLCLAQGRHLIEAELQNETLELPQSGVCQLPEFAWFVAHVLANLPRFQTAYHAALAAYRAAHRIRNHAQPVPDLASAGDGWLEAPLWIWTADEPTRRPLFARRRGDEIEISDRHKLNFTLRLSTDGDATGAIEHLLELAERGIKIRTRALTTTLFARLVLGDLFLHGIGGAKYDQVTNLIATQFFGVELPEFAVVSATLRLPLKGAAQSEYDTLLPQRLRELRYHPERFLENPRESTAEGVSKAAKIVASKRHWVQTIKTPENARQRHLEIQEANEALQPLIAAKRHQWEQQLERQESQTRAAAVLGSREYAFCLLPREHFRRSLLDGLAGSP